MKAQNLNNSSVKTRKLIRTTFAEMLAEKKEIGKISVSELAKRANINRGTFYSHYDDIYSVAEDYENELITNFFDNSRLLSSDNFAKFIDELFNYIKENDEEYRMMCKSDDILFVAKKLTLLASSKCLELCYNDKRLKDKKHLDIEINIFIDGLISEYVKYCRGQPVATPEELREYTYEWLNRFIARRFSSERV